MYITAPTAVHNWFALSKVLAHHGKESACPWSSLSRDFASITNQDDDKIQVSLIDQQFTSIDDIETANVLVS